MHLVLRIELAGFYCAALGLPTSQPGVIYRQKAVICANSTAIQGGIYIGMPLAEAKAVLTGGVCLPWEETPFIEYQNRWLDVCTEFSNSIEPDRQHSAFLDLSGHADPADVARTLDVSLRAIGCIPHLGLAGTKWVAELAAEPLTGNALADEFRLREPLIDPAGYIAPLPVSRLLPVEPEHRRRLQFLGYKTIGDVTSLSLGTLRRQFGESALKIYQAAWGGYFEPVKALYPRDSIQEKLSFDGGVDCMETLQMALTTLAERLSEKLSRSDFQGSEITAWVELEDRPIVKIERSFVKAMQDARAILVALLSLVGGQKTAIVSVRVRMSNLSKVRRRQVDLYGAIAEKASGAQKALSQVRNAFGDNVIQLGNEVAEPRRKKLLRVWKDATGWR